MEQNLEELLPKLEQKVCENVVLFAKAETNQEKPDLRYKDALKSRFPFNVEPFFISPIEFEWMNLEKLFKCLNNPHEYSGLILTSTRCVDSIMEALKLADHSEILKSWSKLDIFTVGKRTHEHLRTKTNLNSLGHHCGSGKELGNFIKQQNDNSNFQKPLLYPCSEVREDSLWDILKRNCIPFDEIFAYRTVTNPFISGEVSSPTGVGALLESLKQVSVSINKFWIAFGATTAKALESKGETVGFDSSEARAKISGWLNRQMKINLSDGRIIIGTFAGTDSQQNIVLSNSVEHLSEPRPGDFGRLLHLVMVPGKHVQTIQIEQNQFY